MEMVKTVLLSAAPVLLLKVLLQHRDVITVANLL